MYAALVKRKKVIGTSNASKDVHGRHQRQEDHKLWRQLWTTSRNARTEKHHNLNAFTVATLFGKPSKRALCRGTQL